MSSKNGKLRLLKKYGKSQQTGNSSNSQDQVKTMDCGFWYSYIDEPQQSHA